MLSRATANENRPRPIEVPVMASACDRMATIRMAGAPYGHDRHDQEASTRTLILLAFSATAGVMVEFYDFFLYGYAAASAFPAIFFPNLPPTEALVFSYLAFCAGFPAM